MSTVSPVNSSVSPTRDASFVSAPARSVAWTSGWRRSPTGGSLWSPLPTVMSSVPPGVQIRSTVILFWVRVPVLSDAMTVVEPSVSTDGSVRTMAFRWAIRETPTLRATVRTMGSDSGIDATASATDVRNMSERSLPSRMPATNTKLTAPSTMSPILRSSLWVSICSGPLPAGPWTSALISPSSVRAPLAVTTPMPRPLVTNVPLNPMLARSAAVASAATGSLVFSVATDSPVSIDSSTLRLFVSISRISAGRRSPLSMRTMSPGTTSGAGMTRSRPSRRTRQSSIDIDCSACTSASALRSCQNPRAALSDRINRMATASTTCCWIAETIAATSRIAITGPRNWRRSTFHQGAALEKSSSFRPNEVNREAASSALSPSIEVSSSRRTAPGAIAYQTGFGSLVPGREGRDVVRPEAPRPALGVVTCRPLRRSAQL